MTTPVVLINGTFVSLTSFSSRNEPTTNDRLWWSSSFRYIHFSLLFLSITFDMNEFSLSSKIVCDNPYRNNVDYSA